MPRRRIVGKCGHARRRNLLSCTGGLRHDDSSSRRQPQPTVTTEALPCIGSAELYVYNQRLAASSAFSTTSVGFTDVRK